METWDAIRARRNVRSYTSQPVGQAELDQILEAGRRAPSARNSQPWDFVVVTGRAELTDLAQVWQGARHVAQSAATIGLVAPRLDDERRREGLRYDLGQATMSMMIAAADLGIKAHAHMLRHACGYKLANDGHDTRAIQAYLGHRNIQNTTRYTALAPQRFKEFFRD